MATVPMHHAICWGCHPNLDGPARCGTLPMVYEVIADVTCMVCMDLDPVPCEKCQPNLFAIYMETMVKEPDYE